MRDKTEKLLNRHIENVLRDLDLDKLSELISEYEVLNNKKNSVLVKARKCGFSGKNLSAVARAEVQQQSIPMRKESINRVVKTREDQNRVYKKLDEVELNESLTGDLRKDDDGSE